MNKFNIQTLGCQMNERDSETIAGMLTEMGYESTDDKTQADIAIINTCSVRDNADKRFFGMLGQLKKQKEKNKNFVSCVCGCMMQQQHIVDEVKQKYPWVDIIFGTHNIHKFPQLLKSVQAEKQRQIDIWNDGMEIIENLPAKRLYKHKAFVNIMFGCNNFCTYCIVPYTRGRERSRDPQAIIDEARNLVSQGTKEITLLGQNVNSYRGRDNVDFADLIYMLNDIEGLERIKFMSSHPKDLSDKLIGAFRDCDRLSNYFHLPVQSGSDEVLKKMNRHYTASEYLTLVEKLREVRPDIGISTDIIVGFPGETEKQFEETLELVKKVQYDSAFTFIYSVRKGTPAEKFKEQVDEGAKHDRFNRLVEEVNRSAAYKNSIFRGRTVSVLVEGVSKNRNDYMTGRSSENKIVNFKGSRSLVGTMQEVEITSSNTFSLMGEMV